MPRNRNQRIGVKYCGGCNPSYDRVALVERMEHNLAGKAEFVSFQESDLDLVLIVCGCETACVDMSAFNEVPVRVISGIPDGELFMERILGA